MDNDRRRMWGPDKQIRLSYGEKLGIWLGLVLAFMLGVAVGHSFF